MNYEAKVLLRDRLRARGYDARLVNGGAFDIRQADQTHYMNANEASELLRSSIEHGQILNITDYGEWGGLNYWYTFP